MAPAEYVGLSDIAKLLGVTTRTVQRYIATESLGFPEPEMVIGGRRIWRKSAVQKWARRTLPLPQGRPWPSSG